jgi:hypothetical protein
MKNKLSIVFLSFLIIGLASLKSLAQTSPHTMPALELSTPWSENQLLEPSALAARIKAGAETMPIIFNIGAVEDIKGAKHIGAVSNEANLNSLNAAVSALPKNTEIVIYCGCCAFAKCPNIRPAFLHLKKLGFTNVKLLDLPVNLKTNWISKGYPLAGS